METPSKIGRYRIESWLASGAMGDVYRGHDPIINRPVAIKVLRRDLVRGGDFKSWLERFGVRLTPPVDAFTPIS